MTADEKEIRLRLPNVGSEIIGIRDIDKRAEIIMKYSPVEDGKAGDVEEEEDDAMYCPHCGNEIPYIETRRVCVRYENLYEDGETEEYDSDCSSDEEYFCPRCGHSL